MDFFQKWFNKTFAGCVLDPEDFECHYDPGAKLFVEQQLTYFCGSAPECLQVGNKAALQQAKANLERYYSVVGLASDLQMSLLVFEQYLPRFFKGATYVYGQMSAGNGAEYKRNQRAKDDGADKKAEVVLKVGRMTLQAEAVLKRNLSLEIDFFAFATRRLIGQGRRLKAVTDGTGVLSKLLRKQWAK